MAEKEARVKWLIDDMGLHGKENQFTGGPLPGGLTLRGLSGGEKRRLSMVRIHSAQHARWKGPEQTMPFIYISTPI